LLKPHTFYRDAAKNVVLQEAIEKNAFKNDPAQFLLALTEFWFWCVTLTVFRNAVRLASVPFGESLLGG
jgi:hypothetical protein